MVSERPRVLIADDEPLTRTKLSYLVESWGFVPVTAVDGAEAWEILSRAVAPFIAVLDWQMPGYTGDQICRMARERLPDRPLYLLLITATRLTVQEKLLGLGAGADDYLIKPFDSTDLRARLEVARKLVGLQLELKTRLQQLHELEDKVRQTQGLLPV